MTSARVVGRNVVRKDIRDKVTGRARYASDLTAPGMAHAVLVRSTVPHGLLRGVDTSAAEALPGVRCVITAADVADCDPFYGESVLDQPFLAIDRVRYVGEPVAGVVADTEEIARLAADLVVVDIEPLPTLGTAEEALAATTVIHPERDSADEGLPNVCSKAVFEYGDVDAALAGAHWVHEATYTFPAVYHYAMEPFACLATWGSDGLDMWSGTQQPFKVRADLARIFRVPISRVQVRVPYVGGGYGAKGQCKYEPVTAALARAAGCPVRLVTSIEESFHTVTRHQAVITMRTGVDAQGTIIARDTRVVYDTGAYADKGPRVARKGAYRAAGPYSIPNTRSVGLAVYSNRVPAGAFRGFSTPQVVWAGESAIDEIALHLGQDPLEYRATRLTPRGKPFLGDDAPMDADLEQGLRMAADAIGWSEPRPPGRGRGVASGVKDGGGGAARSEAEVRLHRDGSVEVIASTCELGQGARTVMAQLAAEGLGVDYDRVHVRLPDTATERFDPGTNASRSTVAVGSAVLEAAMRVHDELSTAVADQLGTSEPLRLEGGDVVAGDQRISLVTLMSAARGLAPDWLGSMSAVAAHDTSKGDGPLGHTSSFYEVGHAAAEVEVDRETGEIRITRYASVADVGIALNPSAVEGQDEGATVMGIGHTLFEELEFEGGELRNASLVDYRVPRTHDLPDEFHTILLENRDGPGPFGAKGAGEGGTLAVAPAVANAVADALGIRIRELPLTPERVWRALRQAEED
jgi:CO/xanthine dehydrogenase Mo-binding subunit